MPGKSRSKFGSCFICTNYVFHLPTEKQRHFSMFHHDYIEQSIKRIKTEHRCNFKTTTSECNLSFPSLKKLQVHRKIKNHPVKSKGTPNQSKKVKYTTKSLKGIEPNLKELVSSQKRCYETIESDEKSQENNQGRQKNMRPFFMKKCVKIMQRTVFGFNVINVIPGQMFIVFYVLQDKKSQKRY